jgi:tripartite-type tricarboxylate transporter receptor subunit TctC
LRTVAGLAMIGIAPTAALAEAYPSRNIRLVVAWPAGATADYFGRQFGEWLRKRTGQTVIVDNVAGVSGANGARKVARSPADGYTLLSGNAPEIAINPHLTLDLGYNPLTDFEQIALLGNVPLGMIVPAKSPYKSLAELLDAARKNPGKLNFASAGFGTPGHFAGEALALLGNAKMVHVAYRGGAPALNDVLGGVVDFYFVGLPAALPQEKAGNVRILAVSTAKRTPVAPEIPTVSESGIPDFDFSLWAGLQAPKGTPDPILDFLNKEVAAFLADPEIQKKVREQGSEPIAYSRKDYVAFVNHESEKYARIAGRLGIKR